MGYSYGERRICDDMESTPDKYERITFLHRHLLCSTQDKPAIPKSWILFDSQSTVDVFSKGELLSNIGNAKPVLTLHCNECKAIVTQNGDLKVYSTVWYHPKGIANILSLQKVQRMHKVTHDSSMMTRFVLHKADGTNHIF